MQHIALQDGATFFLSDTEGAQIHKSVKPLITETVITQNAPNSFREKVLLEHLQGNGLSGDHPGVFE